MSNIQEKIFSWKLGLVKLARRLGSVSQACKITVYSQDSFYHIKEWVRTWRRKGADERQRPITNPEEPGASACHQALGSLRRAI